MKGHSDVRNDPRVKQTSGLAALLGIVLLVWVAFTIGCGGDPPPKSTPNDWDQMRWDQGQWQ